MRKKIVAVGILVVCIWAAVTFGIGFFGLASSIPGEFDLVFIAGVAIAIYGLIAKKKK